MTGTITAGETAGIEVTGTVMALFLPETDGEDLELNMSSMLGTADGTVPGAVLGTLHGVPGTELGTDGEEMPGEATPGEEMPGEEVLGTQHGVPGTELGRDLQLGMELGMEPGTADGEEPGKVPGTDLLHGTVPGIVDGPEIGMVLGVPDQSAEITGAGAEDQSLRE